MEKLILIKLLFVLAALNIGMSFSDLCPDKGVLDPCICKNTAYGLLVKCEDFTETHLFVKALNNLRDYKIENVVLHNLMLKTVMPKDVFEGMEITKIVLGKCNITFSQPAFKGLDESLEILNINEDSVITGSERYKIAKLTNLTELTMKKNPLDKVKNDWLNGKIPNVQKIRLEEDEITEIESRAFADLHHLQYVILNGNRIKYVTRSIFPKPAEKLIEIDLSDNEISFLPEDFFSGMPALKKVTMPGNDLQTLPESTWGSVWNRLKSVLLHNNKITCDDELRWMPKVGWPRVLEAVCVAPSELVGKDLKDVYGNMT